MLALLLVGGVVLRPAEVSTTMSGVRSFRKAIDIDRDLNWLSSCSLSALYSMDSKLQSKTAFGNRSAL